MRKLATAAAVSLALASGGAFGLGLGDIEMRSALNQPMNAEIRLTSVMPGELDGMIVQLASPEAFRRAGIERSQALTDLRFSVDASGPSPVIRITSPRPVVEPFLNFLLEVDWPAGRMVREYTVLLDPPVFMTPSASSRSTAGDTPARTGGDASLVAPAPIERSGPDGSDGFDVELVGGDAEVADSTVVGDDALVAPESAGDAGELVSLDGLDASPGATSSAPFGDAGLAGGSGEVVPLTDLAAPDTEAAARRAAEAEFDVELVGDATEVADDAVTGGAGARGLADASSPTGTGDPDDGEVVSLEPLDPSAIAGGGPAASEPPGTDVRVARGDTLFEIASERADGGVSVQQMMLALLQANEAAFIEGNINLLRAGSVLRVPPADEARRLTQARAVAEVGRQNDLWQDYRDNLRGAPTTRVASADTDGSGGASPDASSSATADGSPASDAPANASGNASDAATDGGDADDGRVLSDSAREILENARAEILNREELRIVAADESSDGAAVVGNAADGDPAARAGAIDRRLQLAREELASTRLEAEDLGEQAEDLGGTAENLDALVTLRQNEVAALEARLAEARRGPADELPGASAGDAAADAGGATADALGDAAAGAAGDGVEVVRGAADGAGEFAGEAVADARNALTDAGQELEDVSLVGEGREAPGAAVAAPGDGADAVGDAASGAADDAAGAVGAVGAAAAATEAAVERPWYQTLVSDPARLAIAGVGGAALLGVLGTLLWRRRKGDVAEYDEDDVQFLDEVDAAEFRAAEIETGPSHVSVAPADGTAGGVAPGAAAAGIGAAGAAGAAALGGAFGRGESRGSMSDTERDAFDDAAFAGGDDADGALDETQVLAGGASAAAGGGADLGRDGDDGLDKDDTISEADVYLAYGLHGQAEELLGRAVERDPDNALYARKLLDTYHAQGNSEAFHRAATDYHARFGGDAAPDWPSVAALGAELRPGDGLYAGAAAGVAAAGAGAAFDDDEFGGAGPAGDAPAGAVSRSFAGADAGVGFDDDVDADLGADLGAGFGPDRGPGSSPDVDVDVDETGLMDQSLDPAFAFDASDLEATGDFSTIADEVAAESEEGVIEFSDFDEPADPGTPRERPAAAAAMDSLDAPELSGFGELDLSSSATAANDKLPAEGGAGVSAGRLADDLTLDLDELSGELELDGTELLDGADDDFEMPDLTADNDRLLGAAGDADGDGFDTTGSGLGASVGDADEMDTMMDLAKAYIDMGDKDSASSALDEIVRSGTPDQVVEAETLLKKIS